MEMSAERRDAVLSVRVEGRIDGANARQFEETIRSAIEVSDRAVILDFELLVFISSAGLRAVLMTAKSLWRRDIGFALCSPPDVVRAAFRTSGFDKIIAIHPTRAAAQAAFDP
ncbi:MAG: STAS domain-containing protein [Alphaproteobacteria bacterium]|nr:STAS domain-containing protein [Alphaproteobacteria bacterium]